MSQVIYIEEIVRCEDKFTMVHILVFWIEEKVLEHSLPKGSVLGQLGIFELSSKRVAVHDWKIR